MHCKVPQCKKGCPIENDIPDWIHELKKGNLGNAISIIRAKSNLPAVCGRVCAHEKQCQGSCVLGKKGEAINIGKLERFVADFDSDNELTHEDIVEKSRGKVAIIGAGPSGITVAGDLARTGFAVEMFEMEAQCGGVLRYGIPEYRLPKEVVAREIRYIEKMGVIIHRNTHVGVEITVDSLFAQGFDAIFIGTGLGKPKLLHDFLHVNISHCKGLAVAAAGRVPLGVDAETPRQVRDSLLTKVCTAEEAAEIQHAADKNLAFSRFWTLKEAYAKYTGEGIGLDFAKLGFTIRSCDDIVFHHPDADRLHFCQLMFGVQTVISLCVPHDPAHPDVIRFPV